jgi:cyclase
MLMRRVIGCLDVDAGRVVKGTRFESLREHGTPAAMAAQYERDGADEIVFTRGRRCCTTCA